MMMRGRRLGFAPVSEALDPIGASDGSIPHAVELAGKKRPFDGIAVSLRCRKFVVIMGRTARFNAMRQTAFIVASSATAR